MYELYFISYNKEDVVLYIAHYDDPWEGGITFPEGGKIRKTCVCTYISPQLYSKLLTQRERVIHHAHTQADRLQRIGCHRDNHLQRQLTSSETTSSRHNHLQRQTTSRDNHLKRQPPPETTHLIRDNHLQRQPSLETTHLIRDNHLQSQSSSRDNYLQGQPPPETNTSRYNSPHQTQPPPETTHLQRQSPPEITTSR